MIVENFAALSAKEQFEFAEALLKTINTESIFSADTKFELSGVEADDLTGGLWINATQTNPIEVPRRAVWTCNDADDAAEDPGFEADYENTIYEDAEKAFKTNSTIINGYTVTLDISDVDVGEAVSVEVDSMTNDDAGIGEYEYFGQTGYDSRPYVEVEGTIIKSCDCEFAFFVEAADTVDITAE